MNLKDYIGDTRTDSLPPGFLKSIKIKYKQEASHVFPGMHAQSNAKKCYENLVEHEAQCTKNDKREDEKCIEEQDILVRHY